MAGSSAQITFAFLAKDAASKSINAIGRNLKGLGSTAKNVARGVALGMAAIATSTAAALGYAIKQASDFNETLNKTRVVLGDASAEVEAFAKTAASSLGLSETEALNAASTFAIFGKSANLSGSDLAGFSTQLTSLAADFGSFYNASNEEAITAIGAALRGETEPIRRFGVLLNDATLRQRAFAMGLIKTTKEALTPQNKVLAAQAEILESAAKTGALGDFANTFGGSLPNQVKALRANFANLTKNIGGAFLPAILKVFKALQPVFDELFGSLANETPKLKKFADTLAEGLVKKIPGFVKAAKRELPPLLDRIKGFFKEATKFATSVGKTLGPEGTITAGIALVGAKIGGLKGALAGVLSTVFTDFGFGPFESLLLGAVSSAVLAGLAQGLASQAALALIAAFKVRMTAAATIPTPIPGGGGGGVPPVVAPGVGFLSTIATALSGLFVVSQLQFAAQDEALKAMESGKAPLWQTLVSPWLWPGAIGDLFRGQQPAFTLPGGGMTNDPMSAKYANGDPNARAFGLYNNPMTAKYTSPEFNIYIGGSAVAKSVVPILAREYSLNPKGGK
jgi:phage-related protein